MNNKATRPELVEHITSLLNQINLDSKYTKDSGDYKELVNKINNIISETATLSKSRITRGNGAEEIPTDETQTKVTGK